MTQDRPAELGLLPAGPGVYRFRDSSGKVLYIGRPTFLRSRVASYWSELGGRSHLTPMVARIARIEAVSCDSVHEAAWLERNLLERFLPPWNRTAGGQESATYLRLDPGPVSPGLSVTFQVPPGDGARYFGPYLGGSQARTAVSALHRILPLPYASARIGAAERDLARLRGIGDQDRAALADRITAILERDPAAVSRAHRQLTRLLDRAAGALAYELAARIRDEIAALAWITCPQRATTLDGANLVLTGWADGMLVEFQLRNGRLDAWSQRPCERADASPALAVTPPAWRDFTQRNAELAARLTPNPALRYSNGSPVPGV